MTITVLNKGFVSLIDYMGSDLSAVNAARVSFGKRSQLEYQCNTCFSPVSRVQLFCSECGGVSFGEGLSKKDRKLLTYLIDHNHISPFRHSTVTFHIKAPIFVFRQWMKHRVASEFNEISGRYVDLSEAEFYIPAVGEFRKPGTTNKQGSDGPIEDANIQEDVYNIYSRSVEKSLNEYKKLISLGVCKEQARCVLPVSLYSEVYWTASLQAIAHFINLRLDGHAQKEIQMYAQAIYKLTESLFPVSLPLLTK